jgi:hypothetical protein
MHVEMVPVSHRSICDICETTHFSFDLPIRQIVLSEQMEKHVASI